MSATGRALLPMLWLLASEDEDPISGLVPYDVTRIAFRLRLPLEEVRTGIAECQASGFIECNETVTEPYSIRSSTVTPEAEAEERQRREETEEPSAKVGKFAFEGVVVKITHEQQAKWQGTFSSINVIEHLKGIDGSYAAEKDKGGNTSYWFPRCAQALAKANQEALGRKGGYAV
ncbi:hypothetical protein [Mesorhizobium sp. B2-3-10]|uniref:hypothetical protein n=1 Tax=Mesorhizobium sp. B2-3-10 TaxID=2589954 RepID=UPI00112911A2|nr:hypothetical protein [Mesorhizobium sp. B2-3-10]TPL94763.1 hypothetical protein FJ943_25090 [Mesorhizobium sp. B2-3-10]